MFGAIRQVILIACALALTLESVAGQVQQAPVLPGAPSAAAGVGQPAGTGAITGVVKDATTGRPVAGAMVSLGRVDNMALTLPRVVTDARGRFVFRDLPANKTYFLGARRFGYAPTRYGWTTPGGSLVVSDIVQIAVADDQWVRDIAMPLWRLGAIGGRVLDERNEPVVGVVVRAFTMSGIAGQSQLVAGPLVTTDDRGVYRLSDLDRGRYVVAVLSVQSTVLATTPEVPQFRAIGEIETGGISMGRASAVSTPGIDVDGRHRLVITNFATPPPPAAGQARAYPATFYPGARSAADAVTIDIGYGDTRNGVDVQLQPVPAVRVSGRLEGAGGPPPQFLLRLLPAGSERLGFGSEAATTIVDRDGTFTFLNVPEGSYSILAQASVMDFTSGRAQIRLADAPGFPGGGAGVGSMAGVPGLSYLDRSGQPAPQWGRAAVVVGGRNVDDVVVTMHPTVRIRGRLAFAEGTKPLAPDRALYLRAQPANGDPSLGYPSGSTTRGDPNFAFTIEGLTGGSYLLAGRSIGSLAVVSVTSDGRDVTDTGFDASLGRDFDDVIITLTDKKTEINGFVSSDRGPVAAAVIVFPVERDRWMNYGWEPTRLRSTRAGANGGYKLPGLPPGEYFLIAVDAGKVDAWVDPAFLAAAAPAATRVSIKWGDTTTADLKLTVVTVK